MSTVTAVTEMDARQGLQSLTRLYRVGFQSAYLDSVLHRAFQHQIQRDEADLARINTALAEFEQKYGLTADEFWQRFLAGQVADTADFMEWNAFCMIKQLSPNYPDILRGDGGDG